MIRALAGTIGNGGPSVVAWQEFRADRPDDLAAWLDEQQVRRVLGVLPAAAVVCRTCTLPDAEDAHLEQALALQAEAHRLEGVPPHRQAAAVLPAATGETSRSGIIVSWPEVATDGDVPAAHFADATARRTREVTFTPDVGAVAALLNGLRPTWPLLWFDRSDGSVALAISHPNGAIVRAARVSAEAGNGWSQDVGRVIAETALSVGHTPSFTESLVDAANASIEGLDRGAGLVTPPEVVDRARERVANTPSEPRWWRDYGVIVGALLAASNQLAVLTQMQLKRPEIAPSRGRRLVRALANPVAAAKITAACVLILLLSPLVISGLRLGLLKLRLPDLSDHLREARQAEVRLAMYRELKEKSWPMTKLLADIACNTPQGVDLDQIRIGYDERIRMSGRARPDGDSNLSAPQVLALMQKNLRGAGMFDEIYLNWGDPNSFGQYEFTLSALVVAPYRRYEYPIDLDYGAWTLASRLYGDGPQQPVVEQPPPPEPPIEESPAPVEDEMAVQEDDGRERPTGRFQSGTRLPGADDPLPGGSIRPGGASLPASQDIPQPLTPEQIAAMDLAEAQETYARLSRALQQARVDDETKQRLWRDWRTVRERVRDLKSGQDTP
jgi:hypothetical protein